MEWIGPLFTNAGGWSAYVAYSDGKWFIGKDEKVEIGKGKSGIMLLPLLQKGYGEDYRTQITILEKGLTLQGKNHEIAKSFPFVVPVLTAYTSMPNWAKFAVDWLPEINLNEESVQIIFNSCCSGNIDQEVKEKTITFLKDSCQINGFQNTK